MLHRATLCDIGSSTSATCFYPLMQQRIDGVDYFSMAEVILATGVCRQTVWRWRKAGRIPQGQLFRDRKILYTESEFRAIREFASRVDPVEPVDVDPPDQLRLFGQGRR